MIKREEVYKIGKLGKTHGVSGELSFLFEDDVFDRADADFLILDIDGILVPFFIEAIVGFDIIDASTARTIGKIAAVDDSTINILFELEDGKLIPASEELITDVDKHQKTITIDLPQGILEL